MRDTQTVPCWLAEYEGELYYLGIQSDMNGDWTPPSLGHRVLVEGTMSPDTSRICGGIVLKPVATSVMPEPDATCNSAVLPAEDRYTVPFAPRGNGPSKQSTPAIGAKELTSFAPPFATKKFKIEFQFDQSDLTPKASRLLQDVVHFAKASNAQHIEIMGYRGAVLLSSGESLTEKTGIAEHRAKEIAHLLNAVGIDGEKITTRWQDEPAAANGVSDFEQRRVTIMVTSQGNARSTSQTGF